MDLGEFLAFRKFFAPVAIQVIFWLGVIAVAIGSLSVMFTHGFGGFIGAIVGFVLGVVLVRIYCELLILLFRIYDELVAIRTGRPPSDPGFEVQPLRATPLRSVPVTPGSVPLADPVENSPIPPL